MVSLLANLMRTVGRTVVLGLGSMGLLSEPLRPQRHRPDQLSRPVYRFTFPSYPKQVPVLLPSIIFLGEMLTRALALSMPIHVNAPSFTATDLAESP
jgi:hypothetical protein